MGSGSRWVPSGSISAAVPSACTSSNRRPLGAHDTAYQSPLPAGVTRRRFDPSGSTSQIAPSRPVDPCSRERDGGALGTEGHPTDGLRRLGDSTRPASVRPGCPDPSARVIDERAVGRPRGGVLVGTARARPGSSFVRTVRVDQMDPAVLLGVEGDRATVGRPAISPMCASRLITWKFDPSTLILQREFTPSVYRRTNAIVRPSGENDGLSSLAKVYRAISGSASRSPVRPVSCRNPVPFGLHHRDHQPGRRPTRLSCEGDEALWRRAPRTPSGSQSASVVAGAPSSMSRARSSRPNPAAATREASRITPTRRAAEGRGSCGSFGPIARARAYTSGTSRSSSERKRSWMSVIGLLQEWTQAFPRLREMHPDRRLAAAEDAGDVAGRQVGVLVQGDRGTLVRAQGRERS